MTKHIKVEQLPCATCAKPWRREDQYACSTCARGAQMFNHVRPVEMQGASVPIFTPWPTKVAP